MCRFIETIKIENGVLKNLDYHIKRSYKTIKTFYGTKVDFSEWTKNIELPGKGTGIYKLRIIYTDKIESFSIAPYVKKQINTLKIVKYDKYFYDYKFENRGQIDKLYAGKGGADDIIITINDKLTDSSYSNIIFRKNDMWFSPLSPLLPGTKLQSLIDLKVVEKTEINIHNYKGFEAVSLINAMIDPFDIVVPIENIY